MDGYVPRDFMGLTPEAEVILHLYREKNPEKVSGYQRYCFAYFQHEKEDFADAQFLEAQINISNYPVHKTANLLLKMQALDEAVEKVFSTPKIVTPYQTSL